LECNVIKFNKDASFIQEEYNGTFAVVARDNHGMVVTASARGIKERSSVKAEAEALIGSLENSCKS